ncbi:AAA family ATPase [Nostoc sp. UHCC 0252]|uniref:trifunctional serine/threonine-protein kinase/ATP-binding protein/sensor histidine kinase n=1 Tax=Nostoc sp. UHCC 0252 TaxID=3110241 RepID=UPI002B1F7B37|nr:AAA family ATPase [Nostoc sp. UHCC 0252]MEA5599953.1 AAA family ATPase [Nostoc sp. UHCC 0252]
MISTLVNIPGYRISEELYNGSRTLVYRGYRETDSLPVVIKLLKNPYPSFSELLSFRNQYTIAKNLNSPLIVQTHSLEAYQNGYALVMEDFGGISLKDYFTSDQTLYIASSEEFLRIAIALCNTLDILYRERIIHKDIKPANILINPETKQVKLIDFSIASLLPRETQTLINPNVLEGTLAYISPEQTGRMNRGIDYRTDFYSLGVTFYELLTGVLPFQSNDPMELVHSHIAKQPPLVIRDEIPQVISDIVMKLMAKNAEDRYQSALGLKFDLENCLHQLQLNGVINAFEIAQRDVCDRFIIPDKLYGRETEVETLLQAFERVCLGATEMILVAGFSGIGKTAVVNEVHKPIVRQRGYFIKGKYDQFQRNIPFSAFVQAFRDLMEQLLTESDVQVLEWKNKVLSAVGENGQVIIEVIPELSKIIGEQPPAIELSGTAAQNRFNLLFQKFTQVFTSAEHPLVMFLDDLQWADSASLKLIQLLMAHTNHLFLIGAYRDNEVDPGHPLMLTLNESQKNQATINTITLAPLSQIKVNQLVADTLKCPEHLAWTLSQLVYQKTQGNPFFATQFLKALHQENLIQFDFTSGFWQCDIAQVTTQSVTDDVVAFMSFQLQKLPPSTQNVLQLSACIGNSFDLATLAIVSQQCQAETATALWKALQEGLILPISDVYKFYVGQENQVVTQENQQPVTYKFLHDRVQQAAYSLIPEDQQQSTHLAIARLLRQSTPDTELEAKIFEIVNHWNRAIAIILDQSEKDNLAQLNLIAGRKAKASNAYEPAFKYFTTGINLLSDGAWQTQTSLILGLQEGATEAAYLCGNYEQIEQGVKVILAANLQATEYVKAYEIQIQAYTTQGRFQEAIAIAQTALTKFNTYLPEQPTPTDITSAVEKVTELLNGRTAEDLLDLPVMTEPEALAIMQLLSSVTGAAYLSASQLFSFIVLTQVILAIQKGNNSLSAFSYTNYAVLLSKMLGDLDTAYDFAQMSSQLVAKLNARFMQPKVNLLLAAFFIHYKSHFCNSLALYREGFQTAQEVGDSEFAGYHVHHMCQCVYITGKDLNTLVTETEPYLNTLSKLNLKTSLNYSYIVLQAVERLQNSQNQSTLTNKTEQIHAELTATNDLIGLHYYWVYSLTTSYLLNQYPQAIQDAIEVRQTLAVAGSGISELVFYFYDSLTALATHTEATDKTELLERVSKNQAILHHRAVSAPMNFQHKYDLVEAEQHRVLGKNYEAGDSYDRAIAGAKENDYIQEEGLANELAAKFYLDWGRQRIAGDYMIEAYYAYSRWGAKAKVADLERRYPQLLAPILQQTRSLFSTRETIFALESVTSTSSSVSDTLDLKAILEASQAISGEIELDKLLSSLLSIVIKNAGANKCVLMLLRDDRLLIKGSITLGSEPVVLQRLPVEESQDIPLKLIYKVKHNRQTTVLLNATVDPTLANDPYIMRQQPKSILCSPILHQGKLLGVLYLENSLVTGAFTSDRVELLNLLCAQAAISLENAQLYERSQNYAQQLEESFAESQQKSEDLQQALQDLQQAQLQMVQSEKMSALGNLVAGVAHEMNNPLGFIAASLKQAKPTFTDIIEHLKLYQESLPNKNDEIIDHAESIDLDYSLEDFPKMIDSMSMACDRLKNISTSLRTFSRADRDYKVPFNIHQGIDSTILILKHRLKANEQRPAIEIVTNYGNLPQVECFPGQLNQVFMNLLANAIDALDESNQGRSFEENKAHPNCITITTSVENNLVKIAIADNGKGMTEQVKSQIFDHLFTTKAVGKGTGLGLAIARQIIVEKHGGAIEVNSQLGEGAEFVIQLPLLV